METSLVVALLGIGFELIVLVAGAVWAVGKIRVTTTKLTTTLEHLATSIDRLDKGIEKLDGKTDEHEGRLIRLEERSR